MNGIQFMERDLTEPGVQDECLERTGQVSKTTIIIDGEVVVGFARNLEQIQGLVRKLKLQD